MRTADITDSTESLPGTLIDTPTAGVSAPTALAAPTGLNAHIALTAHDYEARDRWPAPPTEAAFRGLAGEFVRLIEPHTEADSAALLLNFLVLSGNAIGRTAHFRVGATKHYANTYLVVVGGSGAAGRKGTAHSEVSRLFAMLNPGTIGKTAQGIVSGEGIIWAVRDSVISSKRDKNTGEYEDVVVDEGVIDKRLLLRESEFSQVLRVAGRDTNITSVTLRAAWDNGAVLQTLAKNSPATATGAHLSMIGDITPAELARELSATDKANGFANRVLWCCSRRSKVLPEPEQVGEEDLRRLAADLRDVLDAAHATGAMVREEEAGRLWADVYGHLTRERPGLLGSLVARAEAQVVRLSLIYAVLDGYDIIRRQHLEAALAVWDYCERSAAYLFGDALGDPTADRLLAALWVEPNGLTRDQLRDRLGRHTKADEMTRALKVLELEGLAESVEEKTAGRPRERWLATRGKRGKRGMGEADNFPEVVQPLGPLAPRHL